MSLHGLPSRNSFYIIPPSEVVRGVTTVPRDSMARESRLFIADPTLRYVLVERR